MFKFGLLTTRNRQPESAHRQVRDAHIASCIIYIHHESPVTVTETAHTTNKLRVLGSSQNRLLENSDAMTKCCVANPFQKAKKKWMDGGTDKSPAPPAPLRSSHINFVHQVLV